MARLTASDMVDMVRDSLGGETSETLSDTRILRYINQSYLELSSMYHFDQLHTSTTVTTADGTAAYEMTVSDVQIITDIVDGTNDLKLYPMNDGQYHKFTQGSTVSGTPTYWFISGVGANSRYELTFFPTPAGIYTMTVHYYHDPTELVTTPAATSPVIPQIWDDSIVYRAVSRGWAMLGDLEAAGSWKGLARQNDAAAKKSTYHPSYIAVKPGSVIGRALQDV